jgi:hypothetical protein
MANGKLRRAFFAANSNEWLNTFQVITTLQVLKNKVVEVESIFESAFWRIFVSFKFLFELLKKEQQLVKSLYTSLVALPQLNIRSIKLSIN